MAEIKNRSFNAEPKELVPSKGINEIQDNIIQISFELWKMAQLMKEGSSGFIPLMFTDIFNIDKSDQSSYVNFEYDNNNNITRIESGNDKIIEFTYDNTDVLTSCDLYFKINETIVHKRLKFQYDQSYNIINVIVE